MNKQKLLMVATMLLGAQAAQGAGFEKSVMWSGREAGYAGAGAGVIRGSQSLAFNPAGLVGSSEVSLNVSPSWISLEGPIASVGRIEETDHNFSPPGALLASYRVNDQLGIGVGAYVSGGSKAIYDSVDLSVNTAGFTALSPRISADFTLMEYSVGAGYEVMPGLRLGAAWRILQAKGSLATVKSVTTPANAYSYVNITDAKDTKYNGFRLGAQYDLGDWGLGAAFRNGVDVVAEGGINGRVVTKATGTTLSTATSANASVATSFPWAATLGGHYKLSDSLRLLAGVDYVKYSKNVQLGINGTLAGSALPNIPLNWKNMWNFRLGGEYSAMEALKLRAGYSLTTKVTSATDARATLAPPGTGHLFTAGAGTSFGRFDLDGALEYAFNSGTGSMTTGGTSTEIIAGQQGEFKASTFAVHTGLGYRF